jgi:hypothetical protein
MPKWIRFRSYPRGDHIAKMRTLRQPAALWMRQHHAKASTIRLDAIGVVLIPGNEPSVTHVTDQGTHDCSPRSAFMNRYCSTQITQACAETPAGVRPRQRAEAGQRIPWLLIAVMGR